jgi:CheY-like chemotaxis protein
VITPATVLVVDDDDQVRRMLCAVLSREGYRTAAAADGVSALEQLGREPTPDLVLLDVMMPRMSGEAVARQMCNDPQTAWIPIVVMSGGPSPDPSRWPAAVRAWLPKPVELDDLLNAVAAAVERRPTGASAVPRSLY